MLLRDFAAITLGHPIHRIAREQSEPTGKRRRGRTRTKAIPEQGEPRKETELVSCQVIGLSALQEGYIDHSALSTSELGSKPGDAYLTHVGDVLVSLSRPFSAAYVGAADEGLLIPSSCAIVRVTGEAATDWNPAYVAGYLTLPPVTKLLASQAGGARSMSISIATLGSLDVPEAPIEIQNEIARKLTSHLEMVHLRRELDQVERSMIVSAYANAIIGKGR